MKTLRSKSKFLEVGKVSPIRLDYPYGNVGLMLFVCKMVSCKTNDVLKHLMISDLLCRNGSPFYSKIVLRDLLMKMVKSICIQKSIENADYTSFSKETNGVFQ
jgi:hypothetical protein